MTEEFEPVVEELHANDRGRALQALRARLEEVQHDLAMAFVHLQQLERELKR
jgi:hypothetical protein